MISLFFLALSSAVAQEPSVDAITQQYNTKEQKWLDDYVQKMNTSSLGEITKGYLDTFLYRPIKLSSLDDTPPKNAEVLLFNTLFDESYIPFFIESDGTLLRSYRPKRSPNFEKNHTHGSNKRKESRVESLYTAL